MDTVKIGIIGTGWIAEKMAITLEGMEGVEAYAVASRQLQTACDFADRWGFTRAYGSYEEMLDDALEEGGREEEALAGFGAGLFYLSNVGQWNPLNSTSLPAMGFNGISVALLASSNPIGTIFSAIFISHISVGGSFLSTKYYPTEISDLISGIIIYLCAFSMLFRGKIQKLLFKNADKTNVNAEPAPAEKANAKKEGK